MGTPAEHAERIKPEWKTEESSMSNETRWTPVPGYEICEDGTIISHGTNWRGYGSRPLKWSSDGTGYPVVRMVDADGKRRKLKVHYLVCRAFHGEKPSPCHEVRHLDGNPMNNHADNLAWGTRAENASDRVKHGRQFYPPWDDPSYREYMTSRMRGAKAARAALAKARGES